MKSFFFTYFLLFASHFIIKSFYRKLYSIHSNRMKSMLPIFPESKNNFIYYELLHR
ncbi:hypothetical protein LEP1GSC039_2402 [Leptospira santarosai str. 2000027870]|nr:hypothetical protein LEP1GSC039_2402 [Leptospira santarosai str. 2000027870]